MKTISRIAYSNDKKNKTRSILTVSYTHLDVYKRQVPSGQNAGSKS